MVVYITSLLAGGLASLSPCVLPVLPIMVGSSTQRSKFGPLALALGLIVSFAGLGMLFASVTTIAGITESQIRLTSAWLLVFFGFVLMATALRSTSGLTALPFSSWIAKRASHLSYAFDQQSLVGQFGIGFLLGAAWSPCVGPTLGAALGLAGTEGTRSSAALMIGIFGVGMSLPFLAIGYGFRGFFLKHRNKLLSFNKIAVPVLGVILFLSGILIVSGTIQKFEASIVQLLPQKFFEFINKF